MCTPLQMMSLMIMDAMLATNPSDVAPLHDEATGKTIWILRVNLNGNMVIMGQVYPPYEQDGFVNTIKHLLPDEVRAELESEQSGRKHRIEDDFPNDPAHPSRVNGDTPATVDDVVNEVADADWLRQLFERE